MNGTTFETTVVRVVDGDTVRVATPAGEESLRILSLDTEESHAGGSKPVTPLGNVAKAEAQDFWPVGAPIVLEFPGTEPLEVCWQKYRGNFGRALVHVYRPDGTDYQEHMIRTGFSPYFVKYGYARFAENHARYVEAERDAQSQSIGVWNQIASNGSEINNYAALETWWSLRAEIIEGYRRYVASHPAEPILNTRLDYEQLVQKAQDEEEAVIFTELRDVRQVGSMHGVIGIGSVSKPFDVFLPRIDQPAGEALINLITTRYVAGDLAHPRKGYAYLRGPLKSYHGRPEIVITALGQVSDSPLGLAMP